MEVRWGSTRHRWPGQPYSQPSPGMAEVSTADAFYVHFMTFAESNDTFSSLLHSCFFNELQSRASLVLLGDEWLLGGFQAHDRVRREFWSTGVTRM